MSYELINRTKENISMSGRSFILGREQHRRDMRVALHDLQQRLGQCRNGLGNAQVVGTAGLTPSAECQIRRNMFQKLRCFYTFFTSCGLL
jgi:hypothetical protein